jgi:hypothetical protein
MAENENQPPQPPTPPAGKDPNRPEEGDVVSFNMTAPKAPSSSDIVPIGEVPDPANTSSASLISWAEVIRQAREAASKSTPAEMGDPVKVDAISDKDLLRRIIEEEQRRGQVATPLTGPPDTAKLPRDRLPLYTEEGVKLPAEQPQDSDIIPAQGAGSSIKLDADPAKPATGSGSVVKFPVHEPPSDAGGVLPMPGPPTVEDLPFAEEVPSDDLVPEAEPVLFAEPAGTEPAPDEVGLGEQPARAMPDDSGIDFEDAMGAPASSSSQHSSILEILLKERMPEPAPPASEQPEGPISSLPSDAPGWSGDGGSATAATFAEDLPEEAGPIEELTGADVTTPRPDAFSPDDAVDLYSQGPVGRGELTESGSLQVEEEELEAARRKAELAESSAIDLSSHPSLGGLDIAGLDDPSDNPRTETEEVFGDQDSDRVDLHMLPEELGPIGSSLLSPDLREAVAEGAPRMAPSDEDIDLSVLEQPDEGGSMIHRGRLTLDEEILAAELNRGSETHIEPPVSAGDFDDDDDVAFPPRELAASTGASVVSPAAESAVPGGHRAPSTNRARAERAPKKGGMLVGAIAGLVVGAGGFAGAYFAGLLPSTEEQATTKGPGSPGWSLKNGPDNPGVVIQPAASATPELARQHLESGDPVKALEAYEKLPKDSPTVLAGMGQARWLRYLRETAGKGGKLDANAPDVAQARKDLSTAVERWQATKDAAQEREAARAVLWQGLIEEAFNQHDKARELYQKFGDQFS